jgi:pyruvate kinase
MTDLWITLGPASLGIQQDIFRLGVRGVRLTFSFGTPELQRERALSLRDAASQLGVPCTIIADLPGEKIRLGQFSGTDSFAVVPHQEFALADSPEGDPTATGVLPVPHREFLDSLQVGDHLVIGDGSAELIVESVSGSDVHARATGAGVINQTRGLVLRDGAFTPKCLTDADKSYLEYAATAGAFDMVALSFVNSAQDVSDARRILSECGSELPIVAKIETRSGVAAADEIAQAADVLMAGRGDLALYMPWVELPRLVERIAAAADGAGIPWVLATQVAEGLERFSFPTRAEICDLVHWLDVGCGAVMLSYETVFGANAGGAIKCTRALLDRWGR